MDSVQVNRLVGCIFTATKWISEGKVCGAAKRTLKKAHCFSTDKPKIPLVPLGKQKTEMDFSFVKWTHATFNDIDSYGNLFIERYEIENLMNIQAGDYVLQFAADFSVTHSLTACVSRIQIAIESKWLTNQQSTLQQQHRQKIRHWNVWASHDIKNESAIH